MIPWAIGDRGVCAALMAIGAVLLAAPIRPRAARAAWMALLSAGLINALVISTLPHNLININLVHHYLGAKYASPYGAFYALINAAVERPQVAMRDLDHPPGLFRGDPREQRAYYIDLMRAEGVSFDPLASLDELRERALESGAIRLEAERILKDGLAPGQLDRFRLDARLALDGLTGRDITTDYGFNGSPFYALVKHADPTLGPRFGRGVAYFNLVWQVMAALALAWIAGRAIGLDGTGRLAAAALLFASWDFTGYALPGLVFAGLWLPVAVALVAMRRGGAAGGGVAIAWAGLTKLFPFILLLPAGARLARAALRQSRGERSCEWRLWAGLIGWCATATLALGLVSLLSGRSWFDFLHKIVVQFQSQAYLMNSVSLSQGLFTLGIHNSPLSAALSAAALAALLAMFLHDEDDATFAGALPRRALLLVAATGWLLHTWFNYYTIAPLLLLPLAARRQRVVAAVAALGMALAFIMPEFDDPLLLERPGLHRLKVVPYLLVPAWLVALELRGWFRSRLRQRVIVATMAVAVLVTAGEGWRQHTIRRLDRVGGDYLDQGESASAFERYQRMVRLAPRNAMAHMNEAIALAGMGRRQDALAGFARAASLAPESPPARQNFGRALLGAGLIDEAVVELEAARALAPHDDAVLLDLARARLRQGRTADAATLVGRTLELRPDNRAAQKLQAETRRR